MPEFISLSQAADRLGVSPKTLSYMVFTRALDVSRCPLVSNNRRMIPLDYLPELEAYFAARKMPATAKTNHKAKATTR